MGSNQFYKNKALASLEGNWGKGAIATLIYLIITMGIDWTITAPMGNNLVMSCCHTDWLLSVNRPRHYLGCWPAHDKLHPEG